MRKVSIHIEGMSCGHCVNAVSRALGDMPGVEVESVQLGHAVVSYDERSVSPSSIEEAIADAGYSAKAGAGAEQST